MEQIDRTQYPELDKLLWDTRARFLEPDDALKIYERRWRFVDTKQLKPTEQALIERLAEQAGGFLPSAA